VASYPPPRVIQFVEQRVPGFWKAWLSYMTTASNNLPGLQITSWYRTPAQNTEAGGIAKSQHLYGIALDVARNPDGEVFARFFRDRTMGFWDVIEYPTHYHIELSNRVWPQIEEKLTSSFSF
jgi:hypothetical protein